MATFEAGDGSTETATSTVKASVLHGVRDLRIETRILEPPGPDEVQVTVLSTTLCGSDLHYFNHFRNGDISVREPLTLGHESAGVVSAVGSRVKDLHIGDNVALEVGLPCMQCDLCAEGRYNICRGLRFRSSAKSFPHFQGTLQEKINHPAKMCHKMPNKLSLELGALVEPLSVAMHAAKRASLAFGSKVLILGAGAVGLLCAAMCKATGASWVVIADVQRERVNFALHNRFADHGVVVPIQVSNNIEEKLAFAKGLAALVHTTRNLEENPIGEVDAVFECTGVEFCLQTAIYATRSGGKVMLIGMGNPIQTLPISAAALREVDLIGVFRYANTYKDAIEFVSRSSPLVVDLRKLITQRFRGLDNAPRAFDMARRVKDDDGNLVIKVMIDTT